MFFELLFDNKGFKMRKHTNYFHINAFTSDIFTFWLA